MKKIIGLMLSISVMLSQISLATAEMSPADNIRVHGSYITSIDDVVKVDGVTMVQARVLAATLGISLVWDEVTRAVVMEGNGVTVSTTQDSYFLFTNTGMITVSQPMVIINNVTYVPLRTFAELFGSRVEWNSATKETDLYIKNAKQAEKYPTYNPDALNYTDYSLLMKSQNTVQEEPEVSSLVQSVQPQAAPSATASSAPAKSSSGKVFYSQKQTEWNFKNDGRGYCWVCCYAMAISAATGKTVTPRMVADVNLRKGDDAYMHHADVIAEFGVQFVKALDTNSTYFERYDAAKGATYIKAENDAQAIEAIKEALDRNPQGVMVRYTIYPHTLFAVGYSGNTIYFHEPAYADSDSVSFDQTCLKQYKISDLDFIQVVK